MGALLLVEVLEVRAVLEVVGVYFAFLGNGVGLNVVSEFLDFEGVAFLFKLTLDGLVEDLSMGGGDAATVIVLSSWLCPPQPVRASAEMAIAAMPAAIAGSAFFFAREWDMVFLSFARGL